jgi:23S rRNA pseudouridine1911/1915/1917 synthase
MSRTRVKEALTRGAFSVNGKPTTKHNHPLKPGDRVTIGKPAVADRSLTGAGIAIVQESDTVLVLDKPAGLLSVATADEKVDTAFARLSAHLKVRDAGRPFVVHRLDRDTSGLLLFARSTAGRDTLQAGWDEVRKTYLAVVQGRPREREGRIENYLVEGRDLRVRVCGATDPGAKWAVSVYRVLQSTGSYSLVEVELVTGRKHQIRVHLCGLRCPIIGDTVYGQADNPAGRLGLHATRLCFPDPVTGEPTRVESPLPDALRRVLR